MITAWSTGASASQALSRKRLAAELDERAVERDVELDEPLRRGPSCRNASNAARDRLDVAADRRPAAYRRRLELVPHSEQIVQVVGTEANSDHAPVRPRLDEALALEHLERAPDRAAAHRELGGELRLDERRALGELAVDDRLPQEPARSCPEYTLRASLTACWPAVAGQRIISENC